MGVSTASGDRPWSLARIQQSLHGPTHTGPQAAVGNAALRTSQVSSAPMRSAGFPSALQLITTDVDGWLSQRSTHRQQQRGVTMTGARDCPKRQVGTRDGETRTQAPSWLAWCDTMTP